MRAECPRRPSGEARGGGGARSRSCRQISPARRARSMGARRSRAKQSDGPGHSSARSPNPLARPADRLRRSGPSRQRLFRCVTALDLHGVSRRRALAGPVLPEGGTPGRATTVPSALDGPVSCAVALLLSSPSPPCSHHFETSHPMLDAPGAAPPMASRWRVSRGPQQQAPSFVLTDSSRAVLSSRASKSKPS